MSRHKFFSSFIKDRRGYVAIVFGILALPLIGLAGAAIDYRNIGREYNSMRTAAEAAAVAVARSYFAPGIVMGGSLTTLEDPDILANNIFYANFTNDPAKFTYVTLNPVTIDDTDKTVTVSATAGAKTSLLQIIGFSTFDISVSARAAAVFSSEDVQVHFVFDMSPSMGAPDDGTPPPLNAQGCFFMCHDDGTTIRNNNQMPKMDTILNAIAGNHNGNSSGLIKTLGDAAENNPIPMHLWFNGHYFDHHFHENAYFDSLERDDAMSAVGEMMGGAHYMLGADGVNGGTDLKTSFEEMHAYFAGKGLPGNTKRIVIIISDGMHARAKYPFDPAACTALKADGDIYTLYIKNPESVYRNPNLTYVIPGGSQVGMQALDTWDWTKLLSGGETLYGYYSGLNNAEALMRNCASKDTLAYRAETADQIKAAFTSMAEAMISPTIRVIN
jgi:hypothetical protein